MPPPLPVGPPPLPPPSPLEEGYQVTIVPKGNPPQGLYHVPDASGGFIISLDGIAPINPEVFLENVNLQALQHLKGSLRVSFYVDHITNPHRL